MNIQEFDIKLKLFRLWRMGNHGKRFINYSGLDRTRATENCLKITSHSELYIEDKDIKLLFTKTMHKIHLQRNR